jgi:dihydrofolate reductase
MRQIILCMHTSLDGFVAGPAGEMDWINVDEELFDYTAGLTDEADTALYGRVTYEMMDSYWPGAGDQPNASKHDIHHSQWYNRVAKVVVSDTMKGSHIPNTRIIGGENLADGIQRLKEEPGNNIQIFGSPTLCHALMEHNLIDEYWLFVNPVLLGEGIPLFKNINNRVALKLANSQAFASGVAGLHYRLKQ